MCFEETVELYLCGFETCVHVRPGLPRPGVEGVARDVMCVCRCAEGRTWDLGPWGCHDVGKHAVPPPTFFFLLVGDFTKWRHSPSEPFGVAARERWVGGSRTSGDGRAIVAPRGFCAFRLIVCGILVALQVLIVMKQPWSSGRILACHAGDPSSILGGCMFFIFRQLHLSSVHGLYGLGGCDVAACFVKCVATAHLCASL